MKKFAVGILTGMTVVLLASSANALMFNMVNEGSNDVSGISVSVDDIVGGARLNVSVTGPAIGDINGIFFDLLQDVDSAGVPSNITGGGGGFFVSFATDVKIDEGDVSKAPNNSNIQGNYDDFDVGVSLGDLGMSTYDIQTASLDIFGAGLDATDFTRVGVRLQSVTKDDGRGGSAKYIGVPGGSNTPVPEPVTLLLVGAGLGGVGLLRGRTKS